MDKDRSSRWDQTGEEDDDSSSIDIFSKKPDFFQAFISDRLSYPSEVEEKKPETEEDDDDEETDKTRVTKKKAPLRGILDPLSGLADTSEQPKDSKDKWVENQSPPVEPEPADTSFASPETASQTEEVPTERADDRVTIEESVEMDTVEADRSGPLDNESVVEISHDPVVSEQVKKSDIEEETPENPTAPDSATAQSRIHTQSAQTERAFKAASDRDVEPSSRPHTLVERRVPNQERGGGALLAFLGAEFLSRRRDRKLAKEIRTKEKIAHEHIDRLKQVQLSQREAQETLRLHQQEQIDKLATTESRTARSASIRPVEAPRRSTGVDTLSDSDRFPDAKTAEQPPTPAKSRLFENIRYKGPDYPVSRVYYEYEAFPKKEKPMDTPTLAKETLKEQSGREASKEEILLPLAAEQETLLHQSSARRKQIRPGPVPMSSVLASQGAARGYSVSQAGQASDPIAPGPGLSAAAILSQKTYSQAIGVGVGTAVLILLAALIYYLA